jgi:hypothetical protein
VREDVLGVLGSREDVTERADETLTQWLKEVRLMPEFKFFLGDAVGDIVTGFSGKVVVRVQYMCDPNSYGIQPMQPKADGGLAEIEYLTEGRLEYLVPVE